MRVAVERSRHSRHQFRIVRNGLSRGLNHGRRSTFRNVLRTRFLHEARSASGGRRKLLRAERLSNGERQVRHHDIADRRPNRERVLNWSRFRKTIGEPGRHPNYLLGSIDFIAAGMSWAVGLWISGTVTRLALMTIWSSVFFQIISSTAGESCRTSNSSTLSVKGWFTFRRVSPHRSISGSYGGLIRPPAAGGSI